MSMSMRNILFRLWTFRFSRADIQCPKLADAKVAKVGFGALGAAFKLVLRAGCYSSLHLCSP